MFEEKPANVKQVENVIESDENKNNVSDTSELGDNVLNNNKRDDQTVMEDIKEQQCDVSKSAVRATPKQDSLQCSIDSVNSQILQLQETSHLTILDDETRKMVKNKIEHSGKVKK